MPFGMKMERIRGLTPHGSPGFFGENQSSIDDTQQLGVQIGFHIIYN
jgi:hypothetical protein